jgi:hypothetical protein
VFHPDSAGHHSERRYCVDGVEVPFGTLIAITSQGVAIVLPIRR